MSDEYKPQTFKHPVSGATRTASTLAQEVAVKFDGYRPVKSEAPADDKSDEKSEAPKADDKVDEKSEAPKADDKVETPRPQAPKPGGAK